MRALSKRQISDLIYAHKSDVITKDEMCRLFDVYGDEYFKESSWAPFVLTVENKHWTDRDRKEMNLPRKGYEL